MGKRTLLWDWTLTRDHAGSPVLRQTAASLTGSTEITSVTNWNAWRPPEVPDALPFRPMVRTPAQLEGGEWDMIVGSIDIQAGRPEAFLHYFNEPERIPVSPADAVKAWREKLLPLRQADNKKILKLGSPACASDPAGSQWLDEFFAALAENERPDFLGLHFYTAATSSATSEVDAAKAYLTSRHEKFGLPVIVSEIASTSRDAKDVEAFSRQIAEWMDQQDWIIEYGFFGVMREVADSFVSPAAQLLDKEGNWTDLGKWWVGTK